MPRDPRYVGSVMQGEDEYLAYAFDFAAWGAPSAPGAALYRLENGVYVDVSASLLTGETTLNGTVVTTPLVGPLEANRVFRLEVKALIGAETHEAYLELRGVR